MSTTPTPTENPLDAPIVAVEVFRQSAVVHRKATLPALASGEHTLLLERLPLGLRADTARASIACADGDTPTVEVLDLQLSLDVRVPAEDTAVAEVEQVKQLQRELEQLHRRREELHREYDALLQLRPKVPPPPHRADRERFRGEDPLQAWLDLGALARELRAARERSSRELGLQLEPLEERLRAAEERLARLSSAASRELDVSQQLRLRLRSAGGQPAAHELRLSYQVLGARWCPTYELRVDDQGQQAELVLSALVAQVTGEDWPDVELSLSTADVERRSDLPELGAWRIGRALPPERTAWRPLPEDLPLLFADYDRARPPAPQAAEIERRSVAPRPGAAKPLAEPQELGEAEAEEPDTLVFESGAAPVPQPVAALAASNLFDAGQPPTPAEMAAPAAAVRHTTPKKRERRRAEAKAQAFAPAGAALPASEPPAGGGEAAITPADELLDYSQLVLAAEDEPGRGTLRPRQLAEQLPATRRDHQHVEAVARRQRTLRERLQQLDRIQLPRQARAVDHSAGHFAYRYETEARAALPADGALHRVSVLRAAVPLKLVHRTVPLSDSSVYRLARLNNPVEQPLLAGPLDVFWGNDFLVTAQLDTTAPGARIEANLGVEPRIKVARNTRHSQHEEGLIAGKRVHEDDIRIEIESRLKRYTTVEVLERLPTTEERKVEIKVLHEDPPAERYTQKERRAPIKGGRRWRLEIEPGQRHECRLHYRITLPASSEIVGGGRRA